MGFVWVATLANRRGISQGDGWDLEGGVFLVFCLWIDTDFVLLMEYVIGQWLLMANDIWHLTSLTLGISFSSYMDLEGTFLFSFWIGPVSFERRIVAIMLEQIVRLDQIQTCHKSQSWTFRSSTEPEKKTAGRSQDLSTPWTLTQPGSKSSRLAAMRTKGPLPQTKSPQINKSIIYQSLDAIIGPHLQPSTVLLTMI